MASALLAAMRPQNAITPFDPVLANKKCNSAAPSFSMRKKTLQGDWEYHYFDQFGSGRLVGDLARETVSTKDRAPRYSMRPRSPTKKGPPVPGPGEYTIPSTVANEHPVSNTNPMWQFGSTDRDKTFNGVMALAPKTPAPTEYNVTRDGAIGRVDQEGAPSFSMRGKIQDEKEPCYRQIRSPRPGVHEYDVTHEHLDNTKSNAPKFTMRPKNTTPMRSTTPGPDAYNTPSTVANTEHPSTTTGPGWQFKNGPERDEAFGRVNGLDPKTPSPTEYNVRREDAIGRADQEKVPSFSIRPHLQDPNEPSYKQKRSPRPGVHEYDVTKEHINLTRSKSPKYSMRSKPSTPLRSQSPSPGAYDCPVTVSNAHPSAMKAPQWQFGSSDRENCVGRIMALVPKTPSPQAYNVSRGIGRVDQEATPKYSMRARSKDRRSDVEYKEKVSPRPSANDYAVTHDHVNLSRSKSPMYSMRARSKTPDRRSDRSPGPGCYNVRGSLVRSSSRREASPMRGSPSGCGFGSSKRFDAKKPDTRIYSY